MRAIFFHPMQLGSNFLAHFHKPIILSNFKTGIITGASAKTNRERTKAKDAENLPRGGAIFHVLAQLEEIFYLPCFRFYRVV